MNVASRRICNVYLLLTLLHTLAASLIWGINTLFLLDAGLTNTEAFAANAFFTAGLVLFEIPTGVVADTRGRRTSYLFGTITLALSTALYLLMWQFSAPFWAWAISSVLIGLGFTFFSGAVQAWLVDALTFTGFFREGRNLEAVLARGEIVEGVAMLTGSVAGGLLAQETNLGVPYLVRAAVLALSFVVALFAMRDLGFAPTRGKHVGAEVKGVLRASLELGLGNRPVRWLMLSAPFETGVTLYAFYAMQPFLLELHGDPQAYWIAGLAAAAFASSQIVGGLLVPSIRRLFARRTSVLIVGTVVSLVSLGAISFVDQLWAALALLVAWGLTWSAMTPVRQAYLNALLPSTQRATVLSFDSLMGNAGAVGIQPVLGRSADVWGYPVSYACSAAIWTLGLPFLWLARREKAAADLIEPEADGRS